jgi:hypothetical protein
MASAARAGPDTVDLWRAIATWHHEERVAARDAPGDGGSEAGDALALMLKAHAAFVDSQARLARQWQRLVERSAPLLRARLDDYRAEDDPLPEVRAALIDQVRLYLGEIGELALDHGRSVKEDLEALQRELLPRERDSLWLAPDGRSRAARMART